MKWGNCSRAELLNLVLGLLEPCLKLLCSHLEVLDVGGSAVEKGNLAHLLVGDGESILEPAVTVTKFIMTSRLLRLDALTADSLAADISGVSSHDRRLEVLVGRRLASHSLCRRTGSRESDGVKAMRTVTQEIFDNGVRSRMDLSKGGAHEETQRP